MGKFFSSIVWGVSGCIVSALAAVLNLQVRKDKFTCIKDIKYGPDKRHSCDIYTPITNVEAAPVIIFFYGGSWQYGRKEDYLFLADAFVDRGFVVVIADYRLYPQIRFPAFMDDAAMATVWTYNNIADYGGDPDNIYLCGHSAGAYMAVMLAADKQFIINAGGSHDIIKAAIGIAGIYLSLPRRDPNIKSLFSTAPQSEIRLSGHVNAEWRPVFLAAGEDDGLINPCETLDLEKLTKRVGAPCFSCIYPKVTHFSILMSLARYHQKISLMDDIVNFTNKAKAAILISG